MYTSTTSIRKAPIPTFSCLEIVNLSEVSYLEAYENYCKVHFLTGTSIISTHSLGTMMGLLENELFVRCHKSFAVNLEHILRFHKTLEIELVGGCKVPLARRRKETFLSQLEIWMASRRAASLKPY